MWIAMIMLCSSPFDVRTCNVMIRTSNTFPTLESCTMQVREDLANMGVDNIFSRFQCVQMKGRSI